MVSPHDDFITSSCGGVLLKVLSQVQINVLGRQGDVCVSLDVMR